MITLKNNNLCIKFCDFFKCCLDRFKKRWVYLFAIYFSVIFFAFLFNKTGNYPLKIYIPLFIFIALCVLSFGSKTHRNAFILIMVMGITFSLTTPIFDVPDEPAHLARGLYIVEGHFGMEENNSQFNISEDFQKYIDQIGNNLFNNNLSAYTHNEETINNTAVKATNAYSFISYLPQAFALLLGKFLNLNLLHTFYLGRILNLFAYAVLVSFGIKIIPEFKMPLLVVSSMPMSLYISASYNQDSIAMGLIVLVISFYVNIVYSCQIKEKKIIIFSVLCMGLIVTKLPYVLFSTLLLFIPPSKYSNKKKYWIGVLCWGIVMVFSLVWFLYYSSFTPPHTPQGVDVKEQIISLFVNFPSNFLQIAKAMFSFEIYTKMLYIFGWLTYGSAELVVLYIFFLGGVFIGYPSSKKIPLISKMGTFLIFLLTYICICMSMYLTWTPVGSNIINGVQGRYLIGIIALLPIFCCRNIGDVEHFSKKNDFMYVSISLVFLIAVECMTIGLYY